MPAAPTGAPVRFRDGVCDSMVRPVLPNRMVVLTIVRDGSSPEEAA
jgi:hypothetical protein